MSEEDRLKLENELLLTKSKAQMINLYLDLQQKVEQLEKENEKLKYLVDDSHTMKAFIVEHKKVEQLENIKKEAIKTIEEDILGKKIENVNWDYDECYYSDMPVERVKYLLNILNKGSENNELD